MRKNTTQASCLRLLTPKEELASRKKNFAKIREGILFDLGGEKHFLAVKKVDDQTWEVVEFNKGNRLLIIGGQKPKHSILSFDQTRCLNVRE